MSAPMPTFDAGGLRKTRPRDYVVRFVFGGIVTVATGLIARAYGPSIGGLFLAFPAILPASFTLLKEHDGRREATEAARGAVLGALALVPFALVALWASSRHRPAIALALATAVWIATSVTIWLAVYGRSARARRRGGSARPLQSSSGRIRSS